MLLQKHPVEEADHRTARLVDDADQLGADLQQEQEYANDDEGHPVAEAGFGNKGLNDGASSEKGGDSVDDQNRLAMAETELLQAVMKVALVGSENRLFRLPAAYDRKERIRQRHADNEQRRYERNDRNLLEPEHGQHRQSEAEKQRSGVAHENFRRVEVVFQKSDDGPEQRDREQDDRLLAHERGHDENRADRDRRYAGRQPVQAVDQVDGVCDADDPQNRKRNAEPFGDRLHRRAERNVDEIDLNIEAEYDDAGGGDLNEQLQLRGQREPVVQRAEQHDQRASRKQRHNQVEVIGVQKMFRQKRKEQKHACRKGGIDSHSAQPRHHSRMHLALVGHVHGAHFKSQFPYKRRQRER